MKALFAIFVVSLICVNAIAGDEQDQLEVLRFTDNKLAELDALPDGLSVTHSPNPVSATWDANQELRCKWTYKTTVRPMTKEVTIQEFGMFAWDGERWVFSNITKKPFSRQDFENWYSCPEGVLPVDLLFADPSNWSATSCMRPGKSRWYFIGTDSAGRRVKGEGTVELEAKFKDAGE